MRSMFFACRILPDGVVCRNFSRRTAATRTITMRIQYLLKKSDAAIMKRVMAGSFPPSWRKVAVRVGITFTMTIISTITAMITTKIG